MIIEKKIEKIIICGQITVLYITDIFDNIIIVILLYLGILVRQAYMIYTIS